MVKSSSSLVPTRRETMRPPQRAMANMTMRNANEYASLRTMLPTSVSSPITTVTIAR